MYILHFNNGKVRALEAQESLPDNGLIWVDIERDNAQNWDAWAEPLLGVPIDAEHVADSLNPTHPSFFDGTADYDMLVFEGLGPRAEPLPLATRTSTFFMFRRVLVSVRAPDSISLSQTRQRLLDGRLKPPPTPLMLALLIVDAMVDRFLGIRESLDRYFTQLQDDLFETDQTSRDWRELMRGRREARRLEALCQDQLEALDAWRRGSRFDWNSKTEVRLRDVYEHVDRVMHHAAGQERDLEAAIQLHFSVMAHRTNKVMQVLTVLSAIFFPLTFIAGVYGMNFENMPELHWRYGYAGVLGLMAVIVVAMLVYFRRRRLL